MAHEPEPAPMQQQQQPQTQAFDPRRTQSTSSLQSIKAQQLPVPLHVQQPQQRLPSPTVGGTARDKAPAMLTAMGRSSSSFLTLSSNFFMGNNGSNNSTLNDNDNPTTTTVATIVYDEPGPLLVDLFSRPDGKGAYVKAFRRSASNAMGCAEASGAIRLNDELFAINGRIVTNELFANVIHAAKTAAFPLTLTFHCHRNSSVEDATATPQSTQPQRPPASPVRTANGNRTTSFSAKFGQLIADTGLHRPRSGSFDRQTAAAVTSPSSAVGVDSRSTSTSTSTNSTSSDTPTNNRTATSWGDGLLLDKMKHSSADGMKNLLRRLNGGKTRPEDDKETVGAWFEQLALRPDVHDDDGSSDNTTTTSCLDHATPIVVVTASGRRIGVQDDDALEFTVAWYRKTRDGDLIHIKGATRGRYNPSIDDVDCRLSAHVTSLRFPPLARVVELPRVLAMDPAVRDVVDVLVDAGAGSFSATLASNEFDSFQLKISAARVVLLKIAERECDAGVVVDAVYDAHVQVLLDPTDALRFTLKVREFGSFLGNRKGDTCEFKQSTTSLSPAARPLTNRFSDYSCFFLVAPNPQHRDILALLIRTFRARALASDLELQAHRDEIHLFMDPAFACTTLAPSSQPPAPPLQKRPSSSSNNTMTLATPGGNGASPALPSDAPTPIDRSSGRRSATNDAMTLSVSARLMDLFHLDETMTANDAAMEQAPGAAGGTRTSSFSSSPSSPSRRQERADNSALSQTPDAFFQSRLASQDKQLAMLQDKLSSLAVQLQATEHEKTQLAAALEVKDTRIELQQSKLRSLEALATVHAAQTRELQVLRAKADDDERVRASLQQQLDAAAAAVDATLAQRCDEATQTDERHKQQRDAKDADDDVDGWMHADIASQLSPRSINFEMDYMAATLAKLQQQLADKTRDVAALEDAQSAVVTERNAFRAKTRALSAELRKLVTANRSLADIEAQLVERHELATQLAVARAEAKRVSDERNEFKAALESVVQQRSSSFVGSDRELSSSSSSSTTTTTTTQQQQRRVQSQNTDLQRVVHELTDALHESREQLVATKRINSALVAKLEALAPADTVRSSLVFADGGNENENENESDSARRLSTMSARLHATFSTDEDDEDASDDDSEDDEGFGGDNDVPAVASTGTGVMTQSL